MKTKKCTKCKQEKSLSEFHKSNKIKDGFRSKCKECRKIESRNYYIQNKEAILIYQDKYNSMN